MLANSIQNYLTFRYDNSQKVEGKTIYQDWLPSNSDPKGVTTERKLRSELFQTLNQYENIILPLSGGVDSGLLLIILREVFPKKTIVCVTQRGLYDETREAIRLGNEFATHHYVLDDESVIENIPKMVKITKEPRWNAYNYKLFEFAKNFADCVLVSGDGGDELYGGYFFRYADFMKFKDEGVEDISAYMMCHKNDWVMEQPAIFKEQTESNASIFEPIRYNFTNELEPLEKVMMADYNGKLLYDFLPTAESMSRYYDIPLAAPLMSLKNYATHLPIKEKLRFDRNHVVGKIPLREIALRYGIKLTERKVPYSIDIVKDFIAHEEVVEEFLLKRERKIYEFINYKWVDECFGVDYDIRYVNKWLQLVALEFWLSMK